MKTWNTDSRCACDSIHTTRVHINLLCRQDVSPLASKTEEHTEFSWDVSERLGLNLCFLAAAASYRQGQQCGALTAKEQAAGTSFLENLEQSLA